MNPIEQQDWLGDKLDLVLDTPQIDDPENTIEAEIFLVELLNDPTAVRARYQMLKRAADELRAKGIELSKDAASYQTYPKEIAILRTLGVGEAIDTGAVQLQLLLKFICDPDSLLFLHECVVGAPASSGTVAVEYFDSVGNRKLKTQNDPQKVRSAKIEDEKWGTSSKSRKAPPYVTLLLASGLAAIVSIVGTSLYWNSQMQEGQFVAASAEVKAPEGVMGDDNVSLSLIAGREGFLTIVALPATGEFIPSDCILTPENPKDLVKQLKPGAEHKEIVPISPQTAFIVTVVTATQADHAMRRQFALLEEQLAVVPNKEGITALIVRLLKEVGYESAEISVNVVPK